MVPEPGCGEGSSPVPSLLSLSLGGGVSRDLGQAERNQGKRRADIQFLRTCLKTWTYMGKEWKQ